MARRNFPGETQETLEDWLKDVNEEIATGQTVTGTSSLDQSVSFTTRGAGKARQLLILEDLFQLDPAKYPLVDILPITRTVGRFAQRGTAI